VPCGIYFRLAGPLLWRDFSPAMPIFTGYVLLATALALSLTSFTDPGYIERQKQPAPENGQSKTRKIQTERGVHSFTWCHTCEIWRPPQAHHCSDCGHC
jgi:palmitoyltransferase ZDHHC9/14/18